MADTTNDRDQGGDADALAGLPEAARKETQEILDEIAGDAPKGETPDADKPGDAPKLPEGDKPKEAPKDDSQGKPEARREVKLMPAWLHERAKADWEKREAELRTEIERAKGTPTDNGQTPETPKDQNDLAKKAEALAEKHGITVELAQDLVSLAAQQAGQLPPEIVEKLAAVDEYRNTQAIAAETAAFNTDFDTQILPLIRAEYGSDVSPAVIEQVREGLKEKAYTPEYAKVPYTTIYKGEDVFRGIVATPKKGAEGARGGSTQAADLSATGDQIDLTKPLSDEQIRGLSDAQFDTYIKNMEQFEKSAR